MRLISHRGNTNGEVRESENKPSYIDEALSKGFDVEIDVWFVEGNWYLGHDTWQYEIDLDWMVERRLRLWVHCKNVEAVQEFKRLEEWVLLKSINYLWHQEDDLTITSHGHIWSHPKIKPLQDSVAVKPEINNWDLTGVYGVCSDRIENYK